MPCEPVSMRHTEHANQMILKSFEIAIKKASLKLAFLQTKIMRVTVAQLIVPQC